MGSTCQDGCAARSWSAGRPASLPSAKAPTEGLSTAQLLMAAVAAAGVLAQPMRQGRGPPRLPAVHGTRPVPTISAAAQRRRSSLRPKEASARAEAVDLGVKLRVGGGCTELVQSLLYLRDVCLRCVRVRCAAGAARKGAIQWSS